jgi:hypothetical protein
LLVIIVEACMLRQSARWTIPWLVIKSQIIREWSELDGIGVRVADIEPGFVCRACGKRGARLRPDFNRTAVRAERPAFLARPSRMRLHVAR